MNQFGALITPTRRRHERLKFAYLIVKKTPPKKNSRSQFARLTRAFLILYISQPLWSYSWVSRNVIIF